MISGLIPHGETLLWWVSPDGVVTPLSGNAGADLWLGEGPDGLAEVDVKTIWEAAARQLGETVAGHTMDHAEIDLPVFLFADDAETLRRRREHFEAQFDRFRPGWLCSYSAAWGWRWLGARLGGMKALRQRDHGRRCAYEIVLLVESPLAREADDTAQWVNAAGSGRGQLHLYPGPSEWPAWPRFVLRGPGTFRLRWAGNDVTFPPLGVTEWALVNSDETRPTIRVRDAAGVERNAWPQMRAGQRIPYPVPAGEVTRVDVEVRGGLRTSGVWATVPVRREGLV